MLVYIRKDDILISDTTNDEVAPEQPVVVSNYPLSDGVTITSHDGKEIYIPYRMVNEISKAMQHFVIKEKKKNLKR